MRVTFSGNKWEQSSRRKALSRSGLKASEATMADRFGKLIDLGHPLIIAEADGAVLGYAYASFYRPRAAYRFTCEDSIYLASDAVGRGIGGALLGRLLV